MGGHLLQELAPVDKISAGPQVSLHARTRLYPHTRSRNVAFDTAAASNQDSVLCEHVTTDLPCHADLRGLDVSQHYSTLSDEHTPAERDGTLHAAAHLKIAAAFDVANHNGARA
jgi:hypothetical protein